MGRSGAENPTSLIDRTFRVVEVCAASSAPLTLADLHERTGLPKSTLHRVCGKLVELRVLSHAADGFRVGSKLFALGSMSPELRRLRAAAMPRLHELVTQTGWVTNLAIHADSRALVVEEVYGGAAGIPRMVGVRLPLHATAIGKALLAGFDGDQLDGFLGTGLLRPYTASTVVRPNLLRDQLAGIREAGVAFSHEEWSVGTSGVAAPVRWDGRVVGAVAVIGAPDKSAMLRHAKHVRRAAESLTEALGTVPGAVAA
jgi:DNA-binding IclR family transcriptional regulator